MHILFRKFSLRSTTHREMHTSAFLKTQRNATGSAHEQKPERRENITLTFTFQTRRKVSIACTVRLSAELQTGYHHTQTHSLETVASAVSGGGKTANVKQQLWSQAVGPDVQRAVCFAGNRAQCCGVQSL